ncbi:Pimeloyl-ACP methyl ester carboxylesterase [Enhydrobacter aerosaccus]|uniref:Pimeloyl-ACP methyl ester carboxylesterase n=1 Tax=Enhydrobacter aerosaccus TaxID=225324 RepID=A0A1T4NML4_9HYPH|nr:alpha/beta fold hydrolase [Enhydrobacter aerosaccus]SJZ80345.1 Pimeloyl-ACP methyl ester carboxylesterase [Enhydrobacter aerosaccus]
MVETLDLKTRSGLTFTIDSAGPAGGDLVLLLHGFPESRHSWQAALPALAQAGYRAIAPDQRGYSPGARPDPADLANYAFDKLIGDAIDIADASGAAGRRFHLVGHDWGGQVAWGVAGRHPDRLASLTILSRPHPSSFRRALLKEDGDQKHRSRHHRKFLEPQTGPMLLEDGARRLRRNLASQGVPDAAIEEHLGVLGHPDALEAALAWYRSNKGLAADIGVIRVPTLYVWGDADATVGPDAAHGTREFVSAAYAMEVLPGVGHFVMDQAAARATDLMLQHFKRHPI